MAKTQSISRLAATASILFTAACGTQSQPMDPPKSYSYNDVPRIWERLHATQLRELGMTGDGIRVGIYDYGINCDDTLLLGKCITGLKTHAKVMKQFYENINPAKDWFKPVDPYLLEVMEYLPSLYKGGYEPEHGTSMAQIIAGSENSHGQVGFASGAKVIPYYYATTSHAFPFIFKTAYKKHQVRIVSISHGDTNVAFPNLVDDWTHHKDQPIYFDKNLKDLENSGDPIGRYLTDSEGKTQSQIDTIINDLKNKHKALLTEPSLRHKTPDLIRVVAAKNQGQGYPATSDVTPFSHDVPASGYPDDGNIIIVGAVDEHNRRTSNSLKPGDTRQFFVVVPTTGATSPAAPTVAGILAMLMEADTKLLNNNKRPARQYVDAILQTATRLADADHSGTGPETGRGLVHAEAALEWLTNHPHP